MRDTAEQGGATLGCTHQLCPVAPASCSYPTFLWSRPNREKLHKKNISEHSSEVIWFGGGSILSARSFQEGKLLLTKYRMESWKWKKKVEGDRQQKLFLSPNFQESNGKNSHETLRSETFLKKLQKKLEKVLKKGWIRKTIWTKMHHSTLDTESEQWIFQGPIGIIRIVEDKSKIYFIWNGKTDGKSQG